MKLVDTHVHVVENVHGYARRGEFRAIGNGKARWATGEEMPLIPPELGDVNVTSERLYTFLKAHDVERAILLQGSFYGFQNEYSVETVRKYPDMFVAACSVDPFAEERMSVLDRFVSKEGLRIIKLELSNGGGLMGFHDPFDISGERIASIVEFANRNGCTLVLDLGSPGMKSFQPEAVAKLSEQYPSLKIVICHLLAPTISDEKILCNSLEILSRKNIWFDISAVPWNVDPEVYPYPTGAHFISLARDIVGSKKLMWGSDLPCPLTRDSFEHLVDFFRLGAHYTASELEDIYYNNSFDAYPL